LEGCQAAIDAMRGHGRSGHLINIGSSRSKAEEPGVYGVTKQAVTGIGATLRRELENDDIRVATVIPGGFATQLSRGWLPEQIKSVTASFERNGFQFGGPGTERVVADPIHLARMVRYILEQPIDLNIQEVVVRPAMSLRE
jgi:NADP-dependent 3-hydroxy acid dehydrogenase YdfG